MLSKCPICVGLQARVCLETSLEFQDTSDWNLFLILFYSFSEKKNCNCVLYTALAFVLSVISSSRNKNLTDFGFKYV